MPLRTLVATAALTIWAAALPAAEILPPIPPDSSQSLDAALAVDWTRPTGTVNRALFSTQGFMQIYSHPNPLVLHSFKLTNPTGTQTRLETYIHQMEPANDNDDPGTFDWSRLDTNRMIRFVEDRADFERVTAELGMEPLSLLCYSVDWLKSDDPDDPLASKEEWAEFAAAVVESYNGRGTEYRPNLRLAQVWNEPNMPHFYGGTPDSYFDLFRLTADRLHRDYPGVLVGGPSISHAWHTEPELWMDRFIAECGPWADYVIFHHYGPMGEGTKVLTDEVTKRAAEMRAIPGRESAKVMITETDAWFDGWPKVQFILERQFRFIDLKDLLLGVHHFCCLAYNESGNYTFGIIDEQGGVIEGTFWPYWLFRNYLGNEALALRSGSRSADFDAVASFETRNGAFLATTVIHNRSDAAHRTDVTLFFPPASQDRVLVAESLAHGRHGVERVWRVPAGQETGRLSLDFAAGQARALTLQAPGARHFAFRDINNQEHPWIAARGDQARLPLGGTVTMDVEVVNTLLAPVSGTLRLANVPPDWKVDLVEGDTALEALEPGGTRSVRFRLEARSLGDAGYAAPYAWLDTGDGADGDDVERIAHSIPMSVHVLSPLTLHTIPRPIEAVAGETTMVELQMVNSGDEPIVVASALELPDGFVAARPRAETTVAPGERVRVPFEFSVPAGAGDVVGTVRSEFLGVTSADTFRVRVTDAAPAKARPLNLTPHLNFDPIAFWADREDFDHESMGMFAYPGDYTPSGRVLSIRGVPYRMPDLADGLKCAVLPQGQRVEVPADHYAGAAMIGFGHDGKHPGTWTFHYADGTSSTVDSQIPEWCSPVPEGPENFHEAFTAPTRYVPAGLAEPATQMYAWTLPVDPSRALVAIELPVMEDAYLFAVTLLAAE